MEELKKVDLKKVYDSDTENISQVLNELLKNSCKYSRIGSYFSSKSFISLAEGLSNFISRNGKIKLIINYELDKEDYDEIKKVFDYEKIGEKISLDIQNLKSEMELNSAKVLGWLLSEGKLELRVAIGKDNNLMHIKQGIVEDELGNKVAFTGSANETLSAYFKNIEQIAFFKDWDDGQKEYVKEFLSRFNHFWQDYGLDTRIYPVSKALEEGLIKIRPKTQKELEDVLEKIGNVSKTQKEIITPRPYQQEAINSWKKKYKGIIEMPTGCGKTKTAFFCYKELSFEEKLITLVFAPTIAICDQWMKEFSEEKCSLCKIYDNSKWKPELKKNILDMRLGVSNRLIIVGTYALINNDFLSGQLSLSDAPKFLIADEVHSTGATEVSKGLDESYQYRLGLSATPKRWLDEDGTKKVFDYFGDVVFDKITLYDAIYHLKALCEYDYHLIHVFLNPEEERKYELLTEKISKLSCMKKNDPYNASLESQIQRKLEERANIIKNCEAKIPELERISQKLENERSIVFVSPDQREKVIDIIKHKIKYHQYTFSEKTGIRKEVLANFKNGSLPCIVAIKCLDEGLDVPCATMGVLMASSGNPREFIQRRGRLLRRDSSKTHAEIYDFFVTPSRKAITGSDNVYKNQILRELSRIAEFAKSAKNELDVAKELKRLKEELGI